MTFFFNIVVATPAHSSIGGALTYSCEHPLALGSMVRVPLGKRELLGVVWQVLDDAGSFDTNRIKGVAGVLDVAPLSLAWRQLVDFTASYYQRAIGEVALAALPPQLRELSAEQMSRRLKRTGVATALPESVTPDLLALSQEQQAAIEQFNIGKRPALLFGATGSGKTEVYLRLTQQVLAQDPQAQVLVMVPEINLTPQLQSRFEERFAAIVGKDNVVALHSGLTPAQRLKNWLAAHTGTARLVLGTRMGVLASMPNLRLMVVDEEHDPSYKQQEGARYSARDLAVYRAKLEGCRVLLGSATPSLESWQATKLGRYQRLDMHARIGDGALAQVQLVDMRLQPKRCVLAPVLIDAIAQRVARGEQSMIFLNRRGYAPVLSCHSCEWKSQCPHCSAFCVFHKIDRTLRCHHCGLTERVPRACPLCGDVDIAPVGRGTERLEEHLAELLDSIKRPDGSPVRIARIDADTTRLKGALQAQLASVHAQEVDVLVGTQMIAKGHDFRHITLVAAVNPDSSLFSSDFRAPERLFSLLMQAGGRAGRDAAKGQASEMWVQTFNPQHPLFAALKAHDYPTFADKELEQRQAASLAPFGFSALVRAEARTQETAQAFLNAAASTTIDERAHVTLYCAVPPSVQRVANVERAQMLVESTSRMALQRFLTQWQHVLMQTRKQPQFKSLLRWAVDVDPLVV